MKLLIVIGSTRPGRVGKPIADWVADKARQDPRFDVSIADLAELNLPLLDEPDHPRLRQYRHEHTRRWSSMVDEAEAFIFVAPEYNHSFNAALKNAIDYLNQEWAHKAAALVAYGGVSGGQRAAVALAPVLAAVRLTTVFSGVVIPFVAAKISDGNFSPDEPVSNAVKPMLDEIYAVATAKATLRPESASA